MKKLLGALALFALALVLVLVPSADAKADSPDCPVCHEPCSAVSNGDDTHHWVCSNEDCTGYQNTVGTPEDCSGGTATCVSGPVCDVCHAEYDKANPDNHDWSEWTPDPGNTANHVRVCRRNGCGAKETQPHLFGSWQDNGDGTHTGTCASCGAEITELHYDPWEGTCNYQPHCYKCDRDYGTVADHEMYYEDRGESGHKPQCYHCDTYFFPEPHSGGTATCVSGPVCDVCHAEYGKANPDNHDWGDWTPDPGNTANHVRVCRRTGCGAKEAQTHLFGSWQDNGDGTHSRVCGVCDQTEAGAHSGGKATCTEKAKCEVCGQEYGNPLGHDLVRHDIKAPTCTEIGWDAYDTCSRCDYSTYTEKAKLDHDLIHHDAQAAACTEIGWDAYDTCSRCDYTTYAEKAALGHDIVKHEAKAPDCTETGWDAYETCSRCDYTTYAEKAALGHDVVKHEAKAPDCTETGWDAYETCSRCDYTTYAEKAALGHNLKMTAKAEPTCTEPGTEAFWTCGRSGCGRLFSDAEGLHEITVPAVLPASGHTETADPAVDPTCTTAGLTEGSHCSVCEAVLTAQEEIPALGHSYGSWKPSVRRWHAHSCFRCEDETRITCFLVTVQLGSENSILLCPVCGYCDEMENMEAVRDARISGKKPDGNPAVFLSGPEEGFRLLSVAFESEGKPVRFAGEVTVALPAELISGCSLVLIAPDGTEFPVEYTVNDGWIEFTLSFPQDDQPGSVQVLKLIA